MTTTDELCRMLDERGVEHYDGTESTLWLKDEHGYRASADELSSGRLSVHIWCLTPEQAIAATLGRGECHMTRVEDEERILHGWIECSECGPVYPPAATAIQDAIKYCPYCGRKVVDE